MTLIDRFATLAGLTLQTVVAGVGASLDATAVPSNRRRARDGAPTVQPNRRRAGQDAPVVPPSSRRAQDDAPTAQSSSRRARDNSPAVQSSTRRAQDDVPTAQHETAHAPLPQNLGMESTGRAQSLHSDSEDVNHDGSVAQRCHRLEQQETTTIAPTASGGFVCDFERSMSFEEVRRIIELKLTCETPEAHGARLAHERAVRRAARRTFALMLQEQASRAIALVLQEQASRVIPPLVQLMLQEQTSHYLPSNPSSEPDYRLQSEIDRTARLHRESPAQGLDDLSALRATLSEKNGTQTQQNHAKAYIAKLETAEKYIRDAIVYDNEKQRIDAQIDALQNEYDPLQDSASTTQDKLKKIHDLNTRRAQLWAQSTHLADKTEAECANLRTLAIDIFNQAEEEYEGNEEEGEEKLIGIAYECIGKHLEILFRRLSDNYPSAPDDPVFSEQGVSN